MKRLRLSPSATGLVTIAAILVFVVAVLVSGLPGGPSLPLIGGGGLTVKVELTDADALAPHASVQIAGVKIGEVRHVESDGDKALATLAIERQYQDLHTDAKALLKPHGLFGPKYLELSPGTPGAPLIHDGDTIPAENTVLPVDLDQVLHELQPKERKQLQTAIIELGNAAAGRGSDFNDLLSAAKTLTATLQSPVNRVDSVAPNLNDFLVQNEAFNASFAQAPLDQLVANSNSALGALAGTSQQLQSLLTHADSTLTNLDAALNGEGGSIRSLLEVAPPTIDKLDRFTDLLSLFGANFSGKEPGVSDIRSGIRDAIINPESAFGSWDSCDPTTQGTMANPRTCTPDPDGNPHHGRRYYLRAEVFNFAPSLPGGGTKGPVVPGLSNAAVCGLPVLEGPVNMHTLGCGAGAGYSPGSPGATLSAFASGMSLSSLADLLGV